jgi:hypothetical protein
MNFVDSLQSTLIIALAAMTCISVFAVCWAYYLRSKLRRQLAKTNAQTDTLKAFSGTAMAEAEKHIQTELQHAASDMVNQLRESMKQTASQVAVHIDETTQNTIIHELEKYQVSLQALREQSITEFGKMQKELDEKRIVMQQAIERVARAELARRVDQFNNRLGDVVSSYIVESLGSRVDLGAQLPFILQNLEDHKEDIKRDVLDQ